MKELMCQCKTPEPEEGLPGDECIRCGLTTPYPSENIRQAAFLLEQITVYSKPSPNQPEVVELQNTLFRLGITPTTSIIRKIL